MQRAPSAPAAINPLDFQETRRALEQARHAPGYLYSSPDIYRAEVEAYFRNDWLYVARVEELAEPGDFMALRIVDEPILIARDKDGVLHACYNMCVHRGVEVAYGTGNTKSFKCPYHGWVYDHSGQLTGAAYMKDSPGFDIASCRMKPVKLDVWRGNIFISLNENAPPLDRFVSDFERDFAFLQMENCRLANKIELELDCNWKFVHENLMDFYHVGVLHAKTFGSKFSWDNDKVSLKENGGISIFYDAGPPTPNAEPLLGKMPWLENKPHSYSCTGYLPPNFTIFGRIDCVRPMIVWPTGVGSCRFVVYHLFPESFFDRDDFEEKKKIYLDYQITVLEEDRLMIESMQKAMSSRAYVPGRMSVLEKPLHHFVNGHVDRLLGALESREAAE